MTIKMYRWDIKKWEEVNVAGTQGTQPSVWKPWTWANQTLNPAEGNVNTGGAPFTPSIEMPQDDGSYRNITGEYQNPSFGGSHGVSADARMSAREGQPIPGDPSRAYTALDSGHRSPGQQAVNRFQDQATFSDLWRQQQKWFKDLHASGQDLPPGFAAAQGFPEGTTPKDLMRTRHQHGAAPPALGGAGGSEQNPYTLYTESGKRDIKGPLGSRFMDNLNWLAGLGNFIPGSAGSRERKHFAQQASHMSGAVRNMLTRGRNNPNYMGSESDKRLIQDAIRANLLPRMGFNNADINWLMRTVGGGPERLQGEKDKLGRTAVREHKKTVNPLEEHLKANYNAGSMRAEIADKWPHFNEKDRKTWPRADGKPLRGLVASDLRRVYHAQGDPSEYARLLAEERGESPQDLEDTIQHVAEQLGIDTEDAERLSSALQVETTNNEASQPDVFRSKWESIEDSEEQLLEARANTTDPAHLASIDNALARLGQNKKVVLEEFNSDMEERKDDFLYPGEVAQRRQTAIIDALNTHHADPNVKWDDSQYSQPLYQYITQKVAPNMDIAQSSILKVVSQARGGNEDARKWLDNLIYMWGRAIGGSEGIDPTKFNKSVTEDPMDMAWAMLKLR